jgi:hypothetical protein
MFSKIIMPVMLGAALLVTPMRLPAASCILANTPGEKACAPGCCANKACCQTSQKNTAPPVQPVAKSSSDQQNIAAFPSTVVVAVLDQAATTESSVFSRLEWTAHSPAPLALICIRLI